MVDLLVRSQQGDAIDLVAWRHLGKTVQVFEAILEDPRNYGLCDLPEVLPLNTPIVLPNRGEAQQRVRTVKVWGPI